jgi:hypothetical protein
MSKITTSIASIHAASHLDQRAPGRYRLLEAHHDRLRQQASVRKDRTVLAAEITGQRRGTGLQRGSTS